MESRHWTIRDDEEDVVHEEEIGSGGFGEVHKMRNTKNETSFARKVTRPFAGLTNVDIDNEVRAIRRLCKTHHPNIVQVLKYDKLKEDAKFFYIDMVLCETSLEAFLRRGVETDGVHWETIRQDEQKSLEVSYTILQHIVNGLFYIHTMGEVHRDLSPDNVLFKDGYWKLADFGLASEATSQRLITTSGQSGKNSYRAPEILVGDKGVFNNKADIWAFGCIVFEIFSGGKRAFQHDFEAYQYGKDRETPIKHTAHLDSIGKYYLHGLLECDPANRPSSKELLLTKFTFDGPNIPFDNRPKKRKIDLDWWDLQNQKLLGLVNETIKWSASNAAQPQVFRSLLQGESGESVGEITFRRIHGGQEGEMRPQLVTDRTDPVRLLEKALARPDRVAVLALFQTVSEDLEETLIGACQKVFARYSNFLSTFPLRLPKHDNVLAEAMRRSLCPPLRCIPYSVDDPVDAGDFCEILHAISSSRKFSVSMSRYIPRTNVGQMHIGQLVVGYYDRHDSSITVIGIHTGTEITKFQWPTYEGIMYYGKEMWEKSGQWRCVDIADCRVTLFRLNIASDITEAEILDVCPHNVGGPVISPDRQYLAAGGRGSNDVKTGYGYVLDLETGWRDEFSAPFHPHRLVFSPDGNYLAMVDTSSITVRDVRARKFKFSRNYGYGFTDMAFEPNTNNLYVSKKNGMFEVCKPDGTLDDSESCTRPDLDDNKDYTCQGRIKFSPDGHVLARTDYNRIELYSLDSGIPKGEVFILNLCTGSRVVPRLYFGPPGTRTFATTVYGEGIRIWEYQVIGRSEEREDSNSSVKSRTEGD